MSIVGSPKLSKIPPRLLGWQSNGFVLNLQGACETLNEIALPYRE